MQVSLQVDGCITRVFTLNTSQDSCCIGCINNFIHIHDPDDDAQNEDDYNEGDEPESPPQAEINPENLGHYITQEEKDCATTKWDEIAIAMWEDVLAERERE
jgi:hypothetical protein